MTATINKKYLSLISISLFIWLSGIIITPILASSNIRLLSTLSSFMYFFYQPVCHQLAERSLLVDQIPMAVCIRCFAVYLGGWLVSILYFRFNTITFWPMRKYLLFLIPALMDFIFEKVHFYSNIGLIRFGTGLLLGIVIFQLLILSTASFQNSPESKSIKI